MSDPATCIPSDPSVSGWWYLGHDTRPETVAQWYVLELPWRSHWHGLGSPEDQAQLGYRILGPVLSFAEVEALERERNSWKAALGATFDMVAAQDEIERMKRDWLPIEHAPRDGTEVLVCDDRGNRWVDRYETNPGIGIGWPISVIHYMPISPHRSRSHDPIRIYRRN